MRFIAQLLSLITALMIASSPVHGQTPTTGVEQAVIVHFKYGSKDLKRLFALEDKLETVISQAKAGQYDGNEVATDGSDGFLYFYGPSADRLYEVIKPVLLSASYMPGAKVTLRYGPPKVGVPQRNIVLEK